MKHVGWQRYHIAQWHDGLKFSGKTGIPQRRTPLGEEHSSTLWFPVGSWSPKDYEWVSSGSRRVSQNCVPHSARHSVLPANLQRVGYPLNLLSAATTPLCSCIGLGVPVPKGRWRLSWTKPGLVHTNQTWNVNQMNGSILVLVVQRKCALRNVMWSWCSLWRMTLLDNTAPHCTVKADGTCCLQLHVPACSTTFVQHSGENDTWWYRTPSFFMTMQGVTPQLLSRTCYVAGVGRFWNIHHTHPIWVHAITISWPKWKNHCEGPGTTQKTNLSVVLDGQYGTSRKMDALLVYDAFQTFGRMWWIRGGYSIEGT